MNSLIKTYSQKQKNKLSVVLINQNVHQLSFSRQNVPYYTFEYPLVLVIIKVVRASQYSDQKITTTNYLYLDWSAEFVFLYP